MDSLWELQRKLLPDLVVVMQKRYEILQYIRLMQPIGRRSLSTNLGISERILTSELEFLKDQNLIYVSVTGMTLTKEGRVLLFQLEHFMKEALGLKVLEEKVKEKLNLKQVIVVSGDSDASPWVKKELGRACVSAMKERFNDIQNIISVTGGTTLAAVAEMMNVDNRETRLLFVPARGGIGENVENQANMICAKMAEKSFGEYRMLHVPDQVSSEIYQSIIEEPSIKEVIHLIQSSSMVVHGIGDAMLMAEKRKTHPHDISVILKGNAVAEAFGYYFNENGDVVHHVRTIGLQLNDVKKMDHVISVAGGSSKAKAIKAYLKQANDGLLITDEGAARELIKG
jgi:central glycolytic genes regulator